MLLYNSSNLKNPYFIISEDPFGSKTLPFYFLQKKRPYITGTRIYVLSTEVELWDGGGGTLKKTEMKRIENY